MQDKIIQFLKASDGYVSGEEMSEQLNISRAAVWKYIDQLRHDGYAIAAIPHLGYKFEGAPDKLFANEIQFGLKTRYMGQYIHFFEHVDSTMDEAFRLGMEGSPEGTLVCAETQEKGRGRLGRRWLSPKGKGIYASLILRPAFGPSQMPQLTLLSAVALTEALRKCSGVDVEIKWPNDLLVKGKKLAGILTELRAEMDQVKFVVIGFGININTSAKELIAEAISLKMLTGKSVNRVLVMQEILKSMEIWYERLKKESFEHVIGAWKNYSSTLKSRVRVKEGKAFCEGMAIDLDQDGGLLIRMDNGKIIKKMAGDVEQLR